MDKGLTLSKSVLVNWPKIPQNPKTPKPQNPMDQNFDFVVNSNELEKLDKIEIVLMV